MPSLRVGTVTPGKFQTRGADKEKPLSRFSLYKSLKPTPSPVCDHTADHMRGGDTTSNSSRLLPLQR